MYAETGPTATNVESLNEPHTVTASWSDWKDLSALKIRQRLYIGSCGNGVTNGRGKIELTSLPFNTQTYCTLYREHFQGRPSVAERRSKVPSSSPLPAGHAGVNSHLAIFTVGWGLLHPRKPMWGGGRGQIDPP